MTFSFTLSCYKFAEFMISSPPCVILSIIFSTQNVFVVLNYIFLQGDHPFMFLVIIGCFM